ncbi:MULTISPECIES: LysE family translocator [unclassified Thiomonas]|jgi:threonine/homoserine/homoserine lactone efflux protein|uniref:LysE family translocator n=1 Tax=unclassified Thiomonas TaxID=2625466 RepID=UPI0004DBC480|nr:MULTISPECIES: LysE family translocator [unclassified Thiomonas]CDW95191.1 putative lysine exporter [Thiomonas sp. CB2]VDY03770.1 putative threonine efflux protein [Thiomonas sp. Bio17B3]VDY09053.1 putative threonine efflux protein [Thiomonas sp. Sup16B3]VDY12020.1 putative lysine exporter [Thiomonas sp. OC7]VDY18763.1 putative lysine exporter [Thiomonas sp. CB2]
MDYLSIILFVISTCVTPGPNNVMLMSSGVNFGAARTMRHVIGINIGFPLMLIAVGLGAGVAFHRYPSLHDVLQVVGAVYMLYLAYRIATASTVDFNAKTAAPLGVMSAALFQWVNPKAWVMAVGAVLTYASVSGSYALDVFVIALLFCVFGSPCSLVWVFFGTFLRRYLARPRALRAFNVAMSVVLVVSLVPALLGLVAKGRGDSAAHASSRPVVGRLGPS